MLSFFVNRKNKMTLLTRRNRSLMSQMNVVPYIDVMLVLLVIFMVTTPMFSPSAIQVPRVDHTEAQVSTKQPIEITITEKSQIELINRNEQKETIAVGHPQAFNTIKIWASHLVDKTQPIAISADKNQRYNDVLQVVAALHAGGAKKVALTVQKNTAPNS